MSLSDSTALLPNGQPFVSWEQPLSFSQSYHVAQAHPAASDDNPGTEEKPFRTINAAAQFVQPGERVIVHAGIYRERVSPPRGGSGPDRLISYEAAAGEEVILRGSEIYRGAWHLRESGGATPKSSNPASIWEVELPEHWFIGNNPFGMVNLSRYDDGEALFDNQNRLKDPMLRVYLLRRGLVFQGGRRLRQVFLREELTESDGSYWVDRDGLDLTIRPFADVNPDSATFEMTARQHCFAPSVRGLRFLRVQGFIMEQGGDGFPRPQAGLLSAMRGDHWIIEDNLIRHANGCGMDVGSQSNYAPENTAGDHIIRRNIVDECGICGICGTGSPKNLLVEDNLLRGNCWQNIGNLEESAAIKFHVTRNALVRRNLVLDTGGSSGNGAGIWLDWECRNSRVCHNVIRRTRTIYGAVFIEASRSRDVNLVDHNIILETEGNGIYAHNGDRLQVRHNLIAGTTKMAVQQGYTSPTLFVSTDGEGERGATGRKNVVLGNVLADNAGQIEFANPDNTSDLNAFSATHRQEPGPLRLRHPQENLNLPAWQEFHALDLQSIQTTLYYRVEPNAQGQDALTLEVTEALPATPDSALFAQDFSENQRDAGDYKAGPLTNLCPGAPQQVLLDPRQLSEKKHKETI